MKRTVKFLDSERNLVIAKCEITNRNGYPKFTMSGEYNGSAGQCFDQVHPETEEQQRLIDIWHEWHLNSKNKSLPEGFENDLNQLLDEISQHYHSENDIKVTEEDGELFEDFDKPETVHALAMMLELSTNEIQDVTENGDNRYSVQGTDYLVGTEDEMNEETENYISESLWAFNPSFLSGYGVLSDMDYVDAEGILKFLQKKCESGNDAVKALVKWDENKEEIVQDAISSDGRGHFLNSWDGSELEYCLNDVWYFACRN